MTRVAAEGAQRVLDLLDGRAPAPDTSSQEDAPDEATHDYHQTVVQAYDTTGPAVSEHRGGPTPEQLAERLGDAMVQAAVALHDALGTWPAAGYEGTGHAKNIEWLWHRRGELERLEHAARAELPHGRGCTRSQLRVLEMSRDLRVVLRAIATALGEGVDT